MERSRSRGRFVSTLWVILSIGLFSRVSHTAPALTKPFSICSVGFPLIGSSYLDDLPAYTPIPTVIQQIKDLGANDVRIVVSSGYYNTPTDNLPDPSVDLNPSDSKVVSLIQQLKAAGLQVTFDPFTNVNFNPQGNLIDSVHIQPTDFNIWISAHTAKMVHLAQLAQQGGADRFWVFGDEVQLLTFDPANEAGWLNMITQIRAVFSGSLGCELYDSGHIFNGGNSEIDLTARPLIDALDILGVGWFPMPLTNANDPTICQLLAAWRGNVQGVDSIAFLQNMYATYKKPIVLYASFHSFSGDNKNTNDIYNMAVSLTADQQEQANEYDSYLTVMSKNAQSFGLLGVTFDSWNRFPAGYSGVARYLDSPYGENIQGKLAETILTQRGAPLHNACSRMRPTSGLMGCQGGAKPPQDASRMIRASRAC